MAVTPEVRTVLDALAALGSPPDRGADAPGGAGRAYGQFSALGSSAEMASVTEWSCRGPR